MNNPAILFICGSMNQTTMMHKISLYFKEYNCYFTPYYANGVINFLSKIGVLDFTVLGGQFKQKAMMYLANNNLKIDYRGSDRNYELVITCSDLIIPDNIRSSKIILVQEGMTDPENIMYHLVKKIKLPRWLGSTSTTGLSDEYDKFCVASEGYKKMFFQKGIKETKIEVTGIPNFDNCAQFVNNDFPHHNFVLVATSDARETFKYENRKKFIEYALAIANGRKIIFKLHPNENHERAIKEIIKFAPYAIIYPTGNIEEMIANCSILITKYSSAVYVGLALGKIVYSAFDLNTLKELLPIQNNGASAYNISRIAKDLLLSTKLSSTGNDIFKDLKESIIKPKQLKNKKILAQS